MNLTLPDSWLGRQRFRQWAPLITQQFRLRHVHQILGANFPLLTQQGGSFYYTLHSTSMSAPFYTSKKVCSSDPKWPEINQEDVPNLAATAVVLRVWLHVPSEPDAIITTWGINLSGLVYLGSRLSDIQPVYFLTNAVILSVRGGFFTSHNVINWNGPKPLPFLENVNVRNIQGTQDWKVFRRTGIEVAPTEVRSSYNITKLRKLQALQLSIKNKVRDVELMRQKIEQNRGSDRLEAKPETTQVVSSLSNVRYAPQLLTMTSLNKMLEEKPTRFQKQEMMKIRKEIEIVQFKAKLLSQERDRQSALIRKLKLQLKRIVEQNEETSSSLMESYYQLSKEMEKLKVMRKNLVQEQEIFLSLHKVLCERRRQLMQQLLFIYPIQQLGDKKSTIHGIYLPSSDSLSDCSDAGMSVALGYITHTLVMCASFLQVSLRYPMTHYGSRSYITDHISIVLPDRERDFPLFTKGKERIQFTYAVYLLNKNIAQLRWLFFLNTPELKATLPNLKALLEGKDCKDFVPLFTTTTSDVSERRLDVEVLKNLATQPRSENTRKYVSKMYKTNECGPGLSEILSIPEAFINRQISHEAFRSYAALKNYGGDATIPSIVIKEGRSDESSTVCDNSEGIEQGTDMLDPSLNLNELDSERKSVPPLENIEKSTITLESVEVKYDSESDALSQAEVLDLVLENGSAPGSLPNDSPLTARTDALLTTKSFNLVRPKTNM